MSPERPRPGPSTMIALTRAVPPSITRCELTHLAREPIDVARATAQHRGYEEALAMLGCTIERVAPAPDLPDSVFVEDTAIVLPGVAVIARPGAPSRRPEVAAVATALASYRTLEPIEAPGTLDGGDVLCLGSRLYVGKSARTNEEGIRQLERIAASDGCTVRSVALSGCLHLKSAVTAVGEDALLLNPAWIDRDVFRGLRCITVHPAEPHAANALLVGGRVLHPAAFPRTRERLEHVGVSVHAVAADELAKAEGGLTCCSILVSV